MTSPASAPRPRQSLRRHRAARPVLLALSLFLVGAVYAAVAPATTSSADGAADAQLIAQGKDLFAVNCASCHGLNAEGLAQQGAPALTNVGAAAVDFQVRTGRMPMGNPYAQAVGKQNTFTDDEINALATYVGSLGSGPKVPGEDQYNPDGLSSEDVARGGDLFRTNCSACHNFKGAGGALPNGVRRSEPREDRLGPARLGGHAHRTRARCRCSLPAPSPTSRREDRSSPTFEQVNAHPVRGASTLGGIGPGLRGLLFWVDRRHRRPWCSFRGLDHDQGSAGMSTDLEKAHPEHGELTSPDSPVPDPGVEEHVERYTDVDQAAADRAYRQIVGMLALVPDAGDRVRRGLLRRAAIDAELIGLRGQPGRCTARAARPAPSGLAALLIGMALPSSGPAC